MIPIGQVAPDFEAETTQGRIRFHDWLGDSWGVLFSQGWEAKKPYLRFVEVK